jgi:arginase
MKNRFMLIPYYLDQAETGLEPVAGPDWQINRPSLPAGTVPRRMAALYRPLVDFVAKTAAGGERPVSVAGDCCTSIAVLAGLQRAGLNPTLIWFDAHGDFNPWETTPSGFLGGMPLAMLVGRGEQTIVAGVGLEPHPETQVILTDARDLDREEAEALRDSAVNHLPEVATLLDYPLPDGPLYVHFDTDINTLLTDTPLQEKTEKGEWRFGGIQDEGDYIAGRLGKYKKKTGRRPDEEEKDFVEYEREDTDVTFFVIDLTSSVMAYEYRRDVGEKAPFRIIEAVFNEYHGGDENLSFIPLTDKEEIRKQLEKFAKITRFRFTNLHPTNPDSTDRSRPMDEFLRDANIDSLIMAGRNYGHEGEINL